jgi:hypothetical protein
MAHFALHLRFSSQQKPSFLVGYVLLRVHHQLQTWLPWRVPLQCLHLHGTLSSGLGVDVTLN